MERKRVEELVSDFVNLYNGKTTLEQVKNYVDSYRGEEHRVLLIAYNFGESLLKSNSTFSWGISNLMRRNLVEEIASNFHLQS